MVADLMAGTWEELIWIGHDSYLAIADAALPAAKQFEALQATSIEGRVIDATMNGVAVVAAFTEADDNVPVEVQRKGKRIVALRLCWTTDVDELDESGEGQWREVAMLPLPKGSCVVWTPPRRHRERRGCSPNTRRLRGRGLQHGRRLPRAAYLSKGDNSWRMRLPSIRMVLR
jgi:hypothetical protein